MGAVTADIALAELSDERCEVGLIMPDTLAQSAANSSTEAPPPRWCLYIVQMASGNLYTGISTDVQRRFAEHSGSGVKAARALRGKGPLTLVFQREVGDRAAAQRAEYRLKKLGRSDKLALIAGSAALLNAVFT